MLRPEGLTALSHQLQAGCCTDLRELNISGCIHSRQDSQAFGQALQSGACLTLEMLGVDGETFIENALLPVFEALEAGSCPDLKHLSLQHTRLIGAEENSLARALLSPGLHQLQHLDLCSAFREHSGILPILLAIKQRALPHLRYLNLASNHLDAEKGKALGEALGNGALPSLEKLQLVSNEELGDEGVVAIMRGLEVGKSPGLTRLDLDRTGMGQQGAAAISQAMISGSMRKLNMLVLGFNPSIREEGMAHILRAINANSWPNLEYVVCFKTGASRETESTISQVVYQLTRGRGEKLIDSMGKLSIGDS